MRAFHRFSLTLLVLNAGLSAFAQRSNLFGDINVALKAANGRFIAAEHGGKKPLEATRKQYGDYETFRLIPLDGDLVGLQATVNNRFVTAGPPDGQEPLIADRETIGTWEVFEEIFLEGDKFALKAHNGRYVTLGDKDRLYAQGRTIKEGAVFTYIDLPSMALRTESGLYLSLDTLSGRVTATATGIGRAERFGLTVIGQGRVVLRGVNNRFVRVDGRRAVASETYFGDATAFVFEREQEGLRNDRIILRTPRDQGNLYLMADGGGEGDLVLAKRYDPQWVRFYIRPEVMEPELQPLVLESTLYRGTVLDSMTEEPLVNARIYIQDLQNEDAPRFRQPDDTGDFRFALFTGHKYEITVKSDDHLYYAEKLDLPKGMQEEFVRTIKLPPAEPGMRLGIAGMNFDADTVTLRPDARPALERLVDLMLDNPTLRIEIRTYSIDAETSAQDRKLAEGRARSIVDALVAAGVERERLQYKGIVGRPPEGRAAEFRVLSR